MEINFKTSEEIFYELSDLEIKSYNSYSRNEEWSKFKQKFWLSKEELEKNYIPKSRVEEFWQEYIKRIIKPK